LITGWNKADALAFRLDHVQREQGRERGVDRAPALAQHFRPSLGSARIGGADHAEHASRRSGMRDGTFGDCGWPGCEQSGGEDQ